MMIIKKTMFVLPFLLYNLSYNFCYNLSYKTRFANYAIRSLTMRKDKSQSNNVIPKTKQINYLPRTQNQRKYVGLLDNLSVKMLIAVGPAGTGKTMFACLKAMDLLKRGEINKIIITRPLVTVEEDLGFLPGNIVKKMDPWTRPIFDLFLEYYSRSELDNLINNDIIEISPLAFMRGRTFKESFIIADEMQNSTPNQMKMLTTRIGTNSRMIITGDLQQSDRTVNNGLNDILNKIKIYNTNNEPIDERKIIQTLFLDEQDIERSELVKQIINIYDYKSVISDPSIMPFNNEPMRTIRAIKPIDFDSLYKRT